MDERGAVLVNRRGDFCFRNDDDNDDGRDVRIIVGNEGNYAGCSNDSIRLDNNSAIMARRANFWNVINVFLKSNRHQYRRVLRGITSGPAYEIMPFMTFWQLELKK